MKKASEKLKDSARNVSESLEKIKVIESQQKIIAKCWAKIASICKLYIRPKNANN